MAQPPASASILPLGKLPPTLTPIGHFAGRPALPISRSVTVIGANKHARLRLLSSSVSQHHAIIVNADSGPYIRDLASREHVLVNGARIKESPLHEGDEIQIGRFSFRFTESPHGQTADAVRAIRPAPHAQLEVNGESMPIPLEGKSTLIGRRDTCDVPLLEDSASTCHAVIFEMDGKRYIRDLHSRTGTYINGQEVHHQAELKDGDELKIGETTMRYSAESVPAEESFAPTSKAARGGAPAPAAIPLAPTDSSAPIPVEHIEEPAEALNFEQESSVGSESELPPEGTEALELMQDHPAEIEPVDLAPVDLEAPEHEPAEVAPPEPAPSEPAVAPPKLEFQPPEEEAPAQEHPSTRAPSAPEPSNEDFLADLEALAPRSASPARKKNDSGPTEIPAPAVAEPEPLKTGAAAHDEWETAPDEESKPPSPVEAETRPQIEIEPTARPPVEARSTPDAHAGAAVPPIEVPPEHGAELRAVAPTGTGLPPGTSQLDLPAIGRDEVNLEADLDEASPADTRALPIEDEAAEPPPLALSDQVVDFEEEPDTDAIDDALGLLPEAPEDAAEPSAESPQEPAPLDLAPEGPMLDQPADESPLSYEAASEIVSEPIAAAPAEGEAHAGPSPADEIQALPEPEPEQIVPARSIIDQVEDAPLLASDAVTSPVEQAEPPIEGFAFDSPQVAALEEEVGLSPTLAEQASDDHVTFGGEGADDDAPSAGIAGEIEDGEILGATSPEPESALPLEQSGAAQEVPDVAAEEEFTPSDTGFARAIHDFGGEEAGALVEEPADPSPIAGHSPEAEAPGQDDEPHPIMEADQLLDSDLEPAAETEFPAGASQLDLAPLSPDELQASPPAAEDEREGDKLFDLSAAQAQAGAKAPVPDEEDSGLDLELMPESAASDQAPSEMDVTPEVELIAEPESPHAGGPGAGEERLEELQLEAPESPKTEIPPESASHEGISPAPEAPPPAPEPPAPADTGGDKRERFNWGPNQEHFLGGMPLKLGPGSAAQPAPEPASQAAEPKPAPTVIPPRPNRQQIPPRPIRRPVGGSPFADGRRNTIGPSENRPLRTPFDGLAFAQPSERGSDVFGQNPLPAGLTAGFDSSVVHDVFGGAATRVGLVTPSDASRGAFPTGAEGHPAAQTQAPGAPADEDASQPAATARPNRAAARHLPPEMPPPAPPVKKRRWFGLRMLLLILAIGGCAAASWGIYRYIPDHSSVTGELHFANVDSLSRQRRVDLWKQQQQLLATDALRSDARALLATRSAASGGFLDDPEAFGQVASSAVFDPDRCIVVLSSAGGASLADQQRMLALLEALYGRNQDRVAAYQSLKDKAAAVAAARDASQKTVDELTHQINQLTSASQDRPGDDEKRQLEAQVKQLSSAYVEASATVARMTEKTSPDHDLLRQAQKVRDDADNSLRAAQKQLNELNSRIEEAGTAGQQRDVLLARREAAGQSLAQQARTYDMDHQAAQAQAYPMAPTAADVHVDRKPDSRPRYAAVACGAILALFAGLGLWTMLPSRSPDDFSSTSELPDFADAPFPSQRFVPRQPIAHTPTHEPEPVEV